MIQAEAEGRGQEEDKHLVCLAKGLEPVWVAKESNRQILNGRVTLSHLVLEKQL